MNKLSPSEIERSAKLGLGRIILNARENDGLVDPDIVEHLMLYNTAYDAQVEGSRSWYAVQLIETSKYGDELRQRFIRQASQFEASDDWHEHHRLRLALHYALNDNKQMQELLLDRTSVNISGGFQMGVVEVVELLSDQGIGFLEEQYRLASRSLSDLYQEVARYLPEELWSPEIRRKLTEYGLDKPHRIRTHERQTIPRTTYKDFKDSLGSLNQLYRSKLLRSWLTNATKAEIIQAAKDMQNIDPLDYDALLKYITIFVRTDYPLDPIYLIDIVSQVQDASLLVNDKEVDSKSMLAIRAYAALARLSHPSIREYALSALEQRLHLKFTVGLLAKNYKEGDWKLINEVVQPEASPEILHGIGMGVKEIFTMWPSLEAVPILNLLIDYGPCSLCRWDFYEGLQSLDALSEVSKAELIYDSNEDIRKWWRG